MHQDKVFVADWKNNCVSVFQNDGNFFSAFGQHQMSQYFDIAVNTNSEILVADWGHHCIHVFTLDGDYINEMTIRT